MNDIEKNISTELKLNDESELVFGVSDDDLFKRATKTANNQQGTKDLFSLGMASLWIVLISLLLRLFKPTFTHKDTTQNTPNKSTQKKSTTNNRNK